MSNIEKIRLHLEEAFEAYKLEVKNMVHFKTRLIQIGCYCAEDSLAEYVKNAIIDEGCPYNVSLHCSIESIRDALGDGEGSECDDIIDWYFETADEAADFLGCKIEEAKKLLADLVAEQKTDEEQVTTK